MTLSIENVTVYSTIASWWFTIHKIVSTIYKQQSTESSYSSVKTIWGIFSSILKTPMAKPFLAQHLQTSQNTFSHHQTESCTKQDSFSQTRFQNKQSCRPQGGLEGVMCYIPERLIPIWMSHQNSPFSKNKEAITKFLKLCFFKIGKTLTLKREQPQEDNYPVNCWTPLLAGQDGLKVTLCYMQRAKSSYFLNPMRSQRGHCLWTKGLRNK